MGKMAQGLSDQQVEQVRDELYGVARVVVEAYEARSKWEPFSEAIAALPENERLEAEERAAIGEFDGKLSRDQAERLALTKHLIPRKPA